MPNKHLFFLLLLTAMALALPSYYFDSNSIRFIFFIGVVAIWRYLWALQHFIRALFFLKVKFKRLRQQEQAIGEIADPKHIFILVTSFRIETDTSILVYKSAIAEAIRLKQPVTIIASIVEPSDERLIKQIFYNSAPPLRVSLKLVRIKGSGKRDGLAVGFRAISNSQVDLESAVVAVVDGDSVLTENCIKNCYRFFSINPKLGALTTNESCELTQSSRTLAIYRRWYNLRFAQRHEFMCSVALSNRVLTLTGRMSMFRGDIVGSSEFIDRIEFDYIDHWRLGRFRFLTGDDKSSWFQILKDGWQMLYVPDVKVLTIEQPPHNNFIKGATLLMVRWFGNMLRANTCARQLPRVVMGSYVWWLLRDQLISIWTSLFGLVLAIMGGLYYGETIFYAFAFWILLTRYLLSALLSTLHGHFSLSWPILLYFSQIYGSMVKIYVLSHMYRQVWTRQKTTLKDSGNRLEHFIRTFGSNIALLGSASIFLTVVAFIAGVLTTYDIQAFISYYFS
ncbi:glycosyltransferase [Pseudoalteromonas sp.]|uniref:glycosyltransferase n=1 Tax=Pseudoalteromonas sp. TaxID=53249 RepID=UPI0035653548